MLFYIRLPGSGKIYFYSQLNCSGYPHPFFGQEKTYCGNPLCSTFFFRLAESIVFLTIAILLLFESQWTGGMIQVSIAILYGYIFYCEKKSLAAERISIQHLGINLPGILANRFIPRIEADHNEFIL